MTQTSHLQYRPDIDGIRALAVSMVLIFHAFPLALPGGFIGVDIFFVLSGFLISGIIFKNLDQQHFSLRDFYARRIRRIFPCLVLVLGVTLVVGYFFLFQREYEELGKHSFKSSLFILNFSLAHKNDYFNADSQLRPLLHLWSLSIEEQFYIVWPLLVMYLWRYNIKHLPKVMIALCIISFALNIILVHRNPMDAFYLPFPRFWELLMGSILAWFTYHQKQTTPSLKVRHITGLIGLLLIITGLCVINQDLAFPGWLALLPVCGTYLLLKAGADSWINKYILSHRILVFIGLISYPLYIWHWPVLAFMRIIFGDTLSPLLASCALGSTFILAVLTYYLLEKNIRFSKHKYVVPVLLISLAIIGLTGLITQQGWYKARLSGPKIDVIDAALHDEGYPGIPNFKKLDHFQIFEKAGTDTQRSILIVGDSHAEQYWGRLQHIAETEKQKIPNIVFAAYESCPPLPGVNRTSHEFACDKFNDFAMTLAQQKRFNTIVFIAYWEYYFGYDYVSTQSAQKPQSNIRLAEDSIGEPLIFNSAKTNQVFAQFSQQIAGLKQQGKNVYIVLSNPTGYSFDPKARISRVTKRDIIPSPVDKQAFIKRVAPVMDKLKKIAVQNGAHIIDPVNSLCDKTSCAVTTPDDRSVYRDNNHIRPFYAAEKADFLDQILK